MNPAVSSLIGRPELSSGYSAMPMGTAAQGVSAPVVNAQYSVSAGAQVGQLSLGLMLAGLSGLFVFYLWTKGIQR